MDYELTALGRSLQAPICGLVSWAHANSNAVHEAQARYDAQRGEAAAA